MSTRRLTDVRRRTGAEAADDRVEGDANVVDRTELPRVSSPYWVTSVSITSTYFKKNCFYSHRVFTDRRGFLIVSLSRYHHHRHPFITREAAQLIEPSLTYFATIIIFIDDKQHYVCRENSLLLMYMGGGQIYAEKV